MSLGVFKIMSGSQVSVGYVGAFIDFVWFSGFRWVCRLVHAAKPVFGVYRRSANTAHACIWRKCIVTNHDKYDMGPS